MQGEREDSGRPCQCTLGSKGAKWEAAAEGKVGKGLAASKSYFVTTLRETGRDVGGYWATQSIRYLFTANAHA